MRKNSKKKSNRKSNGGNVNNINSKAKNGEGYLEMKKQDFNEFQEHFVKCCEAINETVEKLKKAGVADKMLVERLCNSASMIAGRNGLRDDVLLKAIDIGLFDSRMDGYFPVEDEMVKEQAKGNVILWRTVLKEADNNPEEAEKMFREHFFRIYPEYSRNKDLAEGLFSRALKMGKTVNGIYEEAFYKVG